jgi:phosphopantothenoylcysteine decarboxylase/phosphopantothenate--cysteine ligase
MASLTDPPAAGGLPVGTAPGRRVLLIVAGGIAAYKSLELVRLLRKSGIAVRAVLTEAGARFVTPLSLQALTEDRVFTDLWSLTDENEMGHIELSRAADLIVVAPATADILARAAAGLADDLAATILLATDKPVLMAPAMNVRMWQHQATQANVVLLASRGVRFVGPDDGEMACHEFGPGRLAEPPAILAAIEKLCAEAGRSGALDGRHVLVTAGPTHEPIDAVRYIANRSSGRQGFAIAAALARLGARVTLVSGPVALPDPAGVAVRRVETAAEMLAACMDALPADAAVCAAAVADWRIAAPAAGKLKKSGGPPALDFVANADILATLAAAGPLRPSLVVGFAAETDHLREYALAKLQSKGCDWIVANDVSADTGVMGGPSNQVHIFDASGEEAWPDLPKQEVAVRLAQRIAAALRR